MNYSLFKNNELLGIKIINSDVFVGLNSLDNNSVDCAITSPPYWGQRDYGFEGQIGNEENYFKYISKLLKIFEILKHKLVEKGVFFLNIGDKYISKYGNSKLGMIPYKMAYFMSQNGWRLEDIIIWYKPNHMPSSVKNRFVNSYEPVFVFTKNEINYYNDHISETNILKVALKSSNSNHVAVYPEKLVYELLSKLKLPNDSTILDPFAGSGTTLKVVREKNYKQGTNYSSVMIESSKEYIETIKKRCKIIDIKLIKLKFVKYDFDVLKDEDLNFTKIDNFTNVKKGLLNIFETKSTYYNYLNMFRNEDFYNSLDKSELFFIGCKDYDIELIYKTSLLNNYNWTLRNLIVVESIKKWYPLFMIVTDNKFIKYRFQYKNLNLNGQTKKENTLNTFNSEKYVGYKVINNLKKDKISGVIVKIDDCYSNKFPKYVIIKWNNGLFSKELIIQNQEIIDKNIIKRIVQDSFFLSEREELTKIENLIEYDNSINLTIKQNLKTYNGKYKNEKKINFGASPGARASTQEEFFSAQRLYSVDQKVIADYLNLKRSERGYTKKQFTDFFPKSYKHTVGHWLRTDFGGSIPIPEDWFLISKILDVEINFTNYVCKVGFKLQALGEGDFKVPDDFITEKFLTDLPKLFL